MLSAENCFSFTCCVALQLLSALTACVFCLCFWNYLHFPYTLHIATARCTGTDTNGARRRECCGRTLNLTLCSNFAVNRKICHARPRHSGAGCASLPPARCRLHPVPHAPRCCCLFPTHVAKVLRMFCSCLFARAEQKVFRRFWRVRKRKCATAAREDDGERESAAVRGTRSVRKIVAYFCANPNALFAYAHLTPAVPRRASLCLVSPAARKFSSKFDKLLATPLCPLPFCLPSFNYSTSSWLHAMYADLYTQL